MSEQTTLTLAQVEAAISRVLLNGEEWQMGDMSSRISLERLIELRDQLRQSAKSSGVNSSQFMPVKFGRPS